MYYRKNKRRKLPGVIYSDSGIVSLPRINQDSDSIIGYY